jgi:methylmalonyl-CoA mutase N-terminal domain/subunit
VPIFVHVPGRAERQGADLSALDGTLQTDIFKEYIAQKEWLFAPEPHLRLIGDLMEYCAREIPQYKPLSVSGYHIREAGSTAAQELAYTLADGFGYVELGLSRGLDVNRSRRAQLLLRRARRLLRGDRQVPRRPPDLGPAPARRVRRDQREGAVAEVPHADRRRLADRAAAGQQRGAHRRRGAGRGARRTNSLHTNALDETLALPTDESAEIALRTQQVLMEETGVVNVADPLGGSWYLEALTDRIEAEAEEIFARIRELGTDGSITAGILRGIEDGWFTANIAEARSSTSRRWRRTRSASSASTRTPARWPKDLEILTGLPRGRGGAERDAGRAPGRPGLRTGEGGARQPRGGRAHLGQHDPRHARWRAAGRGDPRCDLRRG